MPDRYLGRCLGRFRIDALIGTGGFAWVYRGYDPQLDIPVAVKVLKPQYAGEESFEARFRHEASVAAKLRHPNIVRILAVGRDDAASYFVMDYLPTGLEDRLSLMGTLPDALLIRLGMDVAAALAFAHREGVIHRDVKTDNILFDEHGNAVVADFGIARALTGHVARTGTDMVVGTPQYFSPEQARGQTLDGRADIYSLGVTLFRAATGVLPFLGDDWYEVARQHVEEGPPRPRTLNPAVSRPLERVILTCLAKDPADRFQTAEALHAELAPLLGHALPLDSGATVAIRTPVSGGVGRIGPARRRVLGRVPRGAAVGVLAVIAAVVVLFAAQHRRRGSTDRRITGGDGAAPVGAGAVAAGAGVPAAGHTAASVPANGAAKDSGAAPAAAPAPPKPQSRRLTIVAPAGADVFVDGTRVGQGTWRSDTVRPGVHTVRASIVTMAGCATAVRSARVRLRATGRSRATLRPAPCGALAIDARPAGSWYALTGTRGDTVASGTAPRRHPVVVPVGRYLLHVEAPHCAVYAAEFAVAPGATRLARAHLICR